MQVDGARSAVAADRNTLLGTAGRERAYDRPAASASTPRRARQRRRTPAAAGVPKASSPTAARACAAAAIERADRDAGPRTRCRSSRARELLATAEDRDTVFLTLLRAARRARARPGCSPCRAAPRSAASRSPSPASTPRRSRTVLIPLDVVSPFRTVVHEPAAAHRPARVGDPGIDAMVDADRRHDAAVGAADADRAARSRRRDRRRAPRALAISSSPTSPSCCRSASAAADALGRLIVKHKSAGYRAPDERAPPSRSRRSRSTRRSSSSRMPSGARRHRPSARRVAAFDDGTRGRDHRRAAAADRRGARRDRERARGGDAEEAIAEAVERAARRSAR